MKLEIGYNHSFEIRKEIYVSNCLDNFSVLYLSDLHFNQFSQHISKEISSAIDELNPTLVLMGGDYVDSQKGLLNLNIFLDSISHRQNIFAVAGNHDYYFGIDKIKKSMIDHSVSWLEKKSTYIQLQNTKIKIDGNDTKDIINDHDFSILVMHKPTDIKHFAERYNLAFAGHLHGCQFVLWKSNQKLFPGNFFYQFNILESIKNNCHYFISKGLGDTLPIRYNCKRDLIFIEVLNKNLK